MHILFTHSAKEWDREEETLIKSELAAIGLGYIHEPLLQVTYFPMPSSLFQKDWAGIFVTSQHAPWALRLNAPFIKHIPLWCVGEKTSKLARNLGFQVIYEAQGSSETLKELFLTKEENLQKSFLYVRGQDIRKDLKEDLTRLGFSIEEHVAYKTTPVENLSLLTQQAFQENSIKGICLFSVRGAETFGRLMEKCAFSKTWNQIPVFCLSPEVASCSYLNGYNVLYNKSKPSTESLLKMCITYFTGKNLE